MSLSYNTKPLLQSKTFYGAAIAGGSGIMQFAIHHIVGPDVQAHAIPQVLDWMSQVGTVFGSIYAAYGRYIATQRIST